MLHRETFGCADRNGQRRTDDSNGDQHSRSGKLTNVCFFHDSILLTLSCMYYTLCVKENRRIHDAHSCLMHSANNVNSAQRFVQPVDTQKYPLTPKHGFPRQFVTDKTTLLALSALNLLLLSTERNFFTLQYHVCCPYRTHFSTH